MRSCKDTARLLSDARDQPLPLLTRMGLKMHLLMCHLCRRYNHQLDVIETVVVDYSAWAEEAEAPTLSPEARARMVKSLGD